MRIDSAAGSYGHEATTPQFASYGPLISKSVSLLIVLLDKTFLIFPI
jgi:hypothetical protein